MKVRSTLLRLAGAALIAVAAAPWAGGGAANAAAPATYNATLKVAHQGVVAATYANKQTDCPDWSVGESNDSFHFVADGQFVFTSLTVEFSTGTVTVTPNDKHAYVEAPAGATLVNAWATVTPAPTGPLDFQLSHVCVGTPSTSTPTPSQSTTPVTTTTTPVTTTTTPAVTTTTPATPATTPATPAESSPEVSVLPTKVGAGESEEATVAANQLPRTGSGPSALGLTALSLGLVLLGAALIMAPNLAVQRGRNRKH